MDNETATIISNFLYDNYRDDIDFFDATQIRLFIDSGRAKLEENPIWSSQSILCDHVKKVGFDVINDLLARLSIYYPYHVKLNGMMQIINIKIQKIMMNKIKSVESNIMNELDNIKNSLTNKLDSIKSVENNIMNELYNIKNSLTDKLDSIRSILVIKNNYWNDTEITIMDKINSIEKTLDDTIMDKINSIEEQIDYTIMDKINSIEKTLDDTIMDKINCIEDAVLEPNNENVMKKLDDVSESISKTYDSIMILGDVITVNK